MLKGSAKLLFTLCLLLLMTAALSPAASTAQETPPTTNQPPISTIKIPTGPYMTACNTCELSGTDYSCKCRSYGLDSNVPNYDTSFKIDLTTCTVDSDGFYNLTYSWNPSTGKGSLYCSTE